MDMTVPKLIMCTVSQRKNKIKIMCIVIIILIGHDQCNYYILVKLQATTVNRLTY